MCLTVLLGVFWLWKCQLKNGSVPYHDKSWPIPTLSKLGPLGFMLCVLFNIFCSQNYHWRSIYEITSCNPLKSVKSPGIIDLVAIQNPIKTWPIEICFDIIWYHTLKKVHILYLNHEMICNNFFILFRIILCPVCCKSFCGNFESPCWTLFGSDDIKN